MEVKEDYLEKGSIRLNGLESWGEKGHFLIISQILHFQQRFKKESMKQKVTY